jgi:DNA repair protein RadC
MKTEKQILREKAAAYGLKALTDAEILNVLNYKGSIDEFYSSQEFKAMHEILRRREVKDIIKIKASGDAYNILKHLENNNHEQFWVIYLKRNNQVIKDEFISKGDVSGTVVNLKAILKSAINLNASGLVLAHNHPSGEMRPSSADIEMTKKIKEAARLMDINLLDHVIIGDGQQFTKYYSFADEGMI